LTFCPGYLRGLSFVGDYAVVGLSEPGTRKYLSPGLALQDELAAKGGGPRCGLCVIDLALATSSSGAPGRHGAELYDVVVLPGVVRPMAFASRRTRCSAS